MAFGFPCPLAWIDVKVCDRGMGTPIAANRRPSPSAGLRGVSHPVSNFTSPRPLVSEISGSTVGSHGEQEEKEAGTDVYQTDHIERGESAEVESGEWSETPTEYFDQRH